MLHRKFLELAFAGLIANRAIKRMIDQKELHDALAGLFNQIAGGPDPHVLSNRIGARNDRTGHPVDFLITIVTINGGLSRSRAGWHPHLHKAHAAVSGRGKFGVIAIVRNLFAHELGRFDHPCSPWNLQPFAVDLHIDHAFFSGQIFGKLLFSRCGICRGIFAHRVIARLRVEKQSH